MQKDNHRFYEDSQAKDYHFNWGQPIAAVISLLAALVGARVPGYTWILFVSAGFIVITALIMIWNSPLGWWLKKRYYLVKEKRLLSRSYSIYLDFLKEAELIDAIVGKLNGIDWEKNQPQLRINCHNKTYTAFYVLSTLPAVSHLHVMFINYFLKDYIEYINGYLTECDQLVIRGAAKFKSEVQKTEVKKLILKYEEYCDRHDKFCSRINERLLYVKLIPFYCNGFCFSPEIKLPEESKSE